MPAETLTNLDNHPNPMSCFRLLLFLFLLAPLASVAQYTNDLVFGIKAGANHTSISNLSLILVSETHYTGYQFTSRAVQSPAASLFVHYRVSGSRVALEGQLSYFSLATNLIYSDVRDFTYNCNFKYHFAGIGALLKGYVHGGFNVGMGLRFGFNLDPQGITYSSNAHLINWGENNLVPSDGGIQDELRDVIKGLNSTDLTFQVGHEFASGLSLDFSYHHGLNDMIATLVNRHDFIDSINKATSVQLVVGWAIPVDMPNGRGRGR